MSTYRLNEANFELIQGRKEEALQPLWYAAYTAPRHEKSANRHLQIRSIESFLPSYRSTRYWNRRKAVVEMPLFPGYLFVRICSCDRARVLEVPGVLHIIASGGRLTPLPEGVVEALMTTLAARDSQPHPFLAVGDRVRVNGGPMRGLEGTIVRNDRRLRLVVSIDSIQQSFTCELQASDLEYCEDVSRFKACA